MFSLSMDERMQMRLIDLPDWCGLLGQRPNVNATRLGFHLAHLQLPVELQTGAFLPNTSRDPAKEIPQARQIPTVGPALAEIRRLNR